MDKSQICIANYHYKRYSLDYFLDSAQRLGYESVELWASGPHLHLEDFDAGRLRELNGKVKRRGLNVRCFTPDTFDTFVNMLGKDKLGHVHFVDGKPGGHLVPGDGCLDLDHYLEILRKIDYAGYLGLEILDRSYVMDPEKAMSRSMEWYLEHI